jgi:hypothetical protein
MLAFARCTSMFMGTPGCRGAVGQKGGNAEVGAGLMCWVSSDVRGNT